MDNRPTRAYELAFVVMIDADAPLPVLTRQLHQAFAAAKGKPGNALDPTGNQVELRRNDHHDPVLAAAPDNGYLFFPYRLEVSPTDTVSLEHQVGFASALRTAFESLGYRAVICADFEELLEDSGAGK
jgi:hypothetical protein